MYHVTYANSHGGGEFTIPDENLGVELASIVDEGLRTGDPLRSITVTHEPGF